jgi:hypothetical protein
MEEKKQDTQHSFSGWCFKNYRTPQYFPFPGAENFVPSSKILKKGASPRRHIVFPWGPEMIRNCQSSPGFLGHRAGPLKGKVKQILYFTRDDIFERCVFSFLPASFSDDSGIIYVYAVRAEASHFVDKVGTYDIYLATRLIDIKRAFPELKFSLNYGSS